MILRLCLYRDNRRILSRRLGRHSLAEIRDIIPLLQDQIIEWRGREYFHNDDGIEVGLWGCYYEVGYVCYEGDPWDDPDPVHEAGPAFEVVGEEIPF